MAPLRKRILHFEWLLFELVQWLVATGLHSVLLEASRVLEAGPWCLPQVVTGLRKSRGGAQTQEATPTGVRRSLAATAPPLATQKKGSLRRIFPQEDPAGYIRMQGSGGRRQAPSKGTHRKELTEPRAWGSGGVGLGGLELAWPELL